MWLMRGKKELCPRRSRGDYCSQHLFQIRSGAIPFKPCIVCGAGCLVDFRLCMGCGGEALRQRLWRKEKQARTNFKRVMDELLSR